MNRTVRWIAVGVVFFLCLSLAQVQAQQRSMPGDGLRGQVSVAAEPQAPSRTAQAPSEQVPPLAVPRLIKFAGTLKDAQGKALSNTVGLTFAIYKEQEGGAPLWLETQNVELDEQGHYTALLGATKSEGLPLELFTSGESRWLGVQVQLPGEVEAPRVLLVSVPYALKAADAETLGGMPASAFVLAAPSSTASGTSVSGSTTPASGNSKTAGKTAASGKTAAAAAPVAANFIPVFLDNAGTLGSSVMAQSGSFIGVGTTSPAAALHVNGDTLLVTSATTAQVEFAGALSEARFGQDGSGAFFASDTLNKAVRFYTNNGTLNEGLRIDSSSNVGIGTMTPAAKLDVVGNFNLPNTTSGGTAGVIQLGGVRFAHNFGTNNTFLGTAAGNTSMTGVNNSAFGTSALFSNTTGGGNTAVGFNALQANTTGLNNTAVGFNALQANTTGLNNTAVGSGALNVNTGNSNSAFGTSALQANTTGGFNAAFGAGALQSNTSSANSAFGAGALQNNTGVANSAFGSSALFSNTTGFQNAAFGNSALGQNTGGNGNSAFGWNALLVNTTGVRNDAFGNSALGANLGSDNTAFGNHALANLGSGVGNIAIGSAAGLGLNSGSNNIYIMTGGGSGASSESNTIRIGNNQTATFISGISGATVATGDGVGVFVGSQGQLGTIKSSRRYKDDIADMAGESDLLMKLRPVSFYYKPDLDPTHTRQYGLVAEEVAQVSPQLVVFGKDGAPETVRYHFVNAMLLNEVQKQRRQIEAQQRQMQAQQEQLQAQAAQLAELRQALAAELAELRGGREDQKVRASQ